MHYNPFAQQITRLLGDPRRRTITLLGCILFVLLFVLSYSLSIAHDSWKNMLFFCGAFSLFVTKSLLAFTTPKHEIREPGLSWHKQPYILVGILYFGLSLIGLIAIVALFMHNSLPDSVGNTIIGVGLLLVLSAYLRELTLHRPKSGVE